MDKYSSKTAAVPLQNNLSDASNFILYRWCSIVHDIIQSNIFQPPISKAKRKAFTNIFEILFRNKIVELVNVPYVFRDPLVRTYLPIDIKFDNPTVLLAY